MSQQLSFAWNLQRLSAQKQATVKIIPEFKGLLKEESNLNKGNDYAGYISKAYKVNKTKAEELKRDFKRTSVGFTEYLKLLKKDNKKSCWRKKI